MTSQLQILDAVVNSCFKDYLKHLHREWLLRGKYALTPAGRFKKPIVTFISHMIIMPWHCSSSDRTGIKGVLYNLCSRWVC